MGNEKYVIISADGHCGLPIHEYERYLDPGFRPAFATWVAQKEAERKLKLESNYEFIMGWETSNEEGLRGAYDPSVLDQSGATGRHRPHPVVPRSDSCG